MLFIATIQCTKNELNERSTKSQQEGSENENITETVNTHKRVSLKL